MDAKIEETKRSIEMLSHFEHLDIDLDDAFNCDYIRVRSTESQSFVYFGVLPK